MKKIRKCILVGVLGVSANGYAIESLIPTKVDLLIVVEPKLVEHYGSEYINRIISENIDRANKIFNPEFIHYAANAVVVWDENLSEQVDFIGTGYNHLFYSMGITESEYNDIFKNSLFSYTTKTDELLKKYSADQLIYLSQFAGFQGIGAAYRNRGFVHHFKALLNNPYSFAHELGHTWAIPHPENCSTSTKNLLMCQSKYSNQSGGFNLDAQLQIKNIRQNNLSSIKSDLNSVDAAFWNGKYNEPMEMLATAKISVIDNPMPKHIDQTQVIIELVDQSGLRTVLNKHVSIEVFFEGITGIKETDYKEDEFGHFQIPSFFNESSFKRVEFLAGEAVKHINLDVVHQTEQTKIAVGTRYGENLVNSNVIPVSIDSNPDEQQDSKAGSLGQLGLMLLSIIIFCRKRLFS